MSEDDAFCPKCNVHFANLETLRKHNGAIHKIVEEAPAPAAAASTSNSSNKRPRVEPTVGASENVELAPLLGVLTDEQKDALILRAVQADPAFYERILEQASAPLTEEAAEARLGSLDGEGVAAACRWFMQIHVPANALTLLVAASQRCLAALEEYADSLPASGSTAAAATAEEEEDGGEEGAASREELLSAVEALPAAGAIGGLWCELLASRAVARLVRGLGTEEAEAIHLMLEGLSAAAKTVRAVAPGVLVGPKGETVDEIAKAQSKMQAVLSA